MIEVDGYSHHSGRVAFDADRRRRNGITARGLTVLHFTSEMLQGTARDGFLADLHRAFHRPAALVEGTPRPRPRRPSSALNVPAGATSGSEPPP